nr:MAG: MazG-like family protein [Bacteriophage sp.]
MINLESNFEQTITRAIDKFGAEKQLRQMQEEAGELIVATNKIFRENNDQTTKELLEEMADMHIMLQQAVKIICKSETEFIDMINFKLKKLEGYLNE